jgi:hypothetical protein
MNPRKIEHSGNRTNQVIVRHSLFKPERIKQLLLIALQPPHHRPPPRQILSARRNHCSPKPATDFCNKIGTKRTCREVRHLVAIGVSAKRTSSEPKRRGDSRRQNPTDGGAAILRKEM